MTRAHSAGTGPEGSRETVTARTCRDPSRGGVRGGRHHSRWAQRLAPGTVLGRAAFTGMVPRPRPTLRPAWGPLHVSTHRTLDTTRERRLPLEAAGGGGGGGGGARHPLAGAGKGREPTPTGHAGFTGARGGSSSWGVMWGLHTATMGVPMERLATTHGLQAELPGINTF